MKKTNWFQKILMFIIMIPIKLLVVIFAIIGVILLRSVVLANKIHLQLEKLEKAKKRRKP